MANNGYSILLKRERATVCGLKAVGSGVEWLTLLMILGDSLRCTSPDEPRSRDVVDSESLPDFEILLKRYHKKIFSLIYRLVGDPEEVADLTQETFVRAYKAYPKFKGNPSAIYPWLCRIAVNSCKNRFKRLSSREKRELLLLDGATGEADETLSIEVAHSTTDPVSAIERCELEGKIQEAIQALSPEYRTVVVLRDMHGLSYQEIADTTGLSIELVKVRLFRARNILRRRLASYVME